MIRLRNIFLNYKVNSFKIHWERWFKEEPKLCPSTCKLLLLRIDKISYIFSGTPFRLYILDTICLFKLVFVEVVFLGL